MTTPTLLDPESTQLQWQKTDKAQQDKFNTQVNQDVINPPAGQLSDQPYYDQLNLIRQNSASATQGAITADAQQKARQAQLAAQEMERQRAAAIGNAYGAADAYAIDDYTYGVGAGGAGWGGGGAQGVANVLRQAGFAEKDIPTMMAIAKAESSWNPSATHMNSNGSIDQGLFQINSVHKGNSWYPSNPMDPLQSAIAAYNIYKSQGLSAWTVYNSGAYSKYLTAAPPVQSYATNTGSATGVRSVQGGQATAFSGVPTTAARAQALQISRQVLNIPYVWGGTNLNSGVDCSGLVQSVYAQMGITMPRQARAQATTGVRVGSYNQLQPGDLVAFKWAGGYAGANTVSHIAIYVGNGQIIEAAGGSHGDIRSLGNSAQDRGAIYIHTRFPGE